MERIAEICCGSLEDVITAEKAGADRVELNAALSLGGLTPSIASVKLATEICPNIKIVPILRPRGGGFHYNEWELQTMIKDLEEFVKLPIEGVAFGCLNVDGNIHKEQTRKITEFLHQHGKIAVFHRAYDCVKDPYKAMETIIEIGVNRVLTSGLAPKAVDCVQLLAELQKRFGERIEILAGSGVNEANVRTLIEKTGITQYHSSCKGWRKDPTTVGSVSYSYLPAPHESDYEIVSSEKAKAFVEAVKRG